MKQLLILLLLLTCSAMFAQSNQKKSQKNPMVVTYTCPMHPEITSKKPGKCPKCGMTLVVKAKTVVYTCPMHPEVTSNKPGKCPKCGMTLEVKNGNGNTLKTSL